MTQDTVIRKLRKRIDKQKSDGKLRFPPERKLAEELGTSRMTVSKVVSVLVGEGLLTRKRGSGTFVVDKENRGTEKCLAVLFKNIAGSSCPYFTKVKNSLLGSTQNKKTTLQFYEGVDRHFNNSQSANRLLKAISSGLVDGVIIANRMQLEVAAEIKEHVPAVVINDSFGELGGISCITCDYWKAGFEAARYLISRGHKRVGYISRHSDYLETAQSISGMRTACEVFDAEFSESNILYTGIASETFSRRVNDFFSNTSASAFFVRYDVTAARIIKELEKINIRVPDDISIVGAGNYQSGFECDVPLTTVDTCIDEMCKKAGQLLLDKINGKKESAGCATQLLKPLLIERGSVNDFA
ncbi:MAG: LacI family DNA-binding transcriptional regulator [Planctomycetota bacterium]